MSVLDKCYFLYVFNFLKFGTSFLFNAFFAFRLILDDMASAYRDQALRAVAAETWPTCPARLPILLLTRMHRR